ncbi:MAG: O-antigen ligase family protein [Cyclobacteriaceae bacterium]|nr:O-antigen ligase family protein [Cyclobacteriaceae bacterium]
MIPFLIPLISIFFHNEHLSLSNIEVKIPFLIVALVAGFTRLNDKILARFKYGFVLGTLLASSLSLIINSSFVLFLQSTLFIELSYISLYIVIALTYLWFTDIDIKRPLKILFSLFFIGILILSTNTFFIIIGVVIVFAAIIIKGTSLQSKVAVGFLVLLCSAFLYKGIAIQTYLQKAEKHGISGVDKLAQWQCVLEVMKNNELFGVGYNSKETRLIACYHEHSMYKAELNSLNSHNEYLDTFLTLGYIGLLGILIYFLKIMFVAYDTKQVAQLLIIIIIALFSITENVFTRQKGVMITAITTLLVFSSKKKSENIVEDKPITQ